MSLDEPFISPLKHMTFNILFNLTAFSQVWCDEHFLSPTNARLLTYSSIALCSQWVIVFTITLTSPYFFTKKETHDNSSISLSSDKFRRDVLFIIKPVLKSYSIHPMLWRVFLFSLQTHVFDTLFNFTVFNLIVTKRSLPFSHEHTTTLQSNLHTKSLRILLFPLKHKIHHLQSLCVHTNLSKFFSNT